MSVNQMDLYDVYQILNDIHQQATGQSSIAPVNEYEFVSMATSTLAAGTDTVYTALLSTIGRSIFSIRPYERKFADLVKTTDEWGAITTKVSYADKDIPDPEQIYHPIDGSTVDPWKINKSDIVQTRYYGSMVYQDYFTVFEEQLRQSMRSGSELGAFISGQVTNMSNKWEQYLEEINRATLCNFIAAKYSQTNGIVHLLTDYAAETGVTLTDQTCWQPSNLPFWRWVRARVNTIARRMAERSEEYQMKLTGHHIMRHTPNADLRIKMFAPALDQIDAMVNTITFHDEPLAYAGVEGVTYWQNINSPDEIQATPAYIDGTGAVATGTAQTLSNVLGVMYDRDAVGTNVYHYASYTSPFNPRGEYYNQYLNARIQAQNDMTEKGVVLILD